MDVILSPTKLHFKIFTAFYVRFSRAAPRLGNLPETSFPCLWDSSDLQCVNAWGRLHLHPTFQTYICLYYHKYTVDSNIHTEYLYDLCILTDTDSDTNSWFVPMIWNLQVTGTMIHREGEYRGGLKGCWMALTLFFFQNTFHSPVWFIHRISAPAASFARTLIFI